MPRHLARLTLRLRRRAQDANRLASKLAQAVFQTGAPALGLFGVVLIWAALLHSLTAEREQALQGAAQNTANLSRAFEEHIIRSLKAVDQTLLYIRDSYEKNPAEFDIATWTRSIQGLTDLTIQISVLDRNGIVIGSNLPSPQGRLDLSDREHFRVHRDSTADALFVSKPVMGRLSHKWSIQLTRKMIAPGGAFDGVIVVSLDPLYLSRFYEAVDLGNHGEVELIGVDGVIRARAPGGKQTDGPSPVGMSLLGGRLLTEYGRNPSGSYIAPSEVDGTERVIAYRGVHGTSLLVSVGTAVDEVLATYHRDRGTYIALATAVSAVLLLVTALVVIRQGRLNRARELLSASEASHADKSRMLEITLEHMSQGIMMVDVDRRVQVCNRRAIEKLSLSPEFMEARPTLDALLRWQWQQGEFGTDGADVPEDVRRFILSGGASDQPQAYERRRPNGTVLEIRSLPLEGGGFVRTYTDITSQKETEATLLAARERADQAAKAKSEFLATMSHEIRSPMSGLVGMVDLLRETALDHDQLWMAGMIHSSAQNLLAVLNDILDFSKIDAGALAIALEPVLLRELITDTTQPHALAAARKKVQVDIRWHPGLPDRVQTDPLRLRQILTNLLANAVKFTPAGAITVTVDCTGTPPDRLRLCVQDSGIGMAPDVLERLFSPFMQADASTTRDFGGTGLGLCICQRLAGLLDGTLTVESQFGLGSSFTLTLPLVEAMQPEAELRAATPLPIETSAKGRALVADDDATNRWISQRQLTRLGWTVDVAEDGQAALAMLGREGYDLLLTDCHMPKLDGVALAKAVRANPRQRNLPIIGLTADATSAERERCLQAGMNEIAVKPINRAHLARLLQAVLPSELTASLPPQRSGSTQQNLLPVLAETCLQDLFSPGDQEINDWIEEYFTAATEVLAKLHTLLDPTNAAPLDRAEIAAAAHRFAGSSLSIGAARLGAAAQQLETAAMQGSPQALTERFASIQREMIAARDAIEAFAGALSQAEPV